MICPIGERARGAYSGAQWLLRLRSPEKDSGSGDQSAVESLREFSYTFPPNMVVIVFCTSPDSMYPGNLTRTSGGARATLRAVSGLVLAAQSCREDQDSDVKWGRGWLSGGGLAGGESQRFPTDALDGHAGSRGHHR